MICALIIAWLAIAALIAIDLKADIGAAAAIVTAIFWPAIALLAALWLAFDGLGRLTAKRAK
ncbi:hypothetical protein LZK98_08185 [Sphingomonas cannabina]|uniref:hypothetical protein n=1 Tax=Sphingomonas cannabina TaxID=2899123 RepID=UPI001F1CB0D9|nr:hypothetical protein [Sphingomonas cannabina]UIJ46907.1 hypothetical protein LZK98_08185 [Sphingomonas cannabina]